MRLSLPDRKILGYCLAAALPAMLVAMIFNAAQAFDVYLFWTDLQVFGYIMQAEFLAAASGILMIMPLLVKAKGRAQRILRLVAFLVSGYAMAWIAYDADGTEGMIFYALLVFVTFGGGTLFVFDWLSGVTRTFLSLLRWSMSIFLYVSFQLFFELDVDIAKWKDTEAVIPFGATFFYALFALEILLYPALTWYLENKLVEDQQLADVIDSSKPQ